MQQADFQKFKAVMAGMGRVFGAEIDTVILDAYWLALREWPLDEFEQAASHLLANNTFMPKPADFTKLRKAGEQTAGEAWAEVRAALRRMDYSNPPQISPRIDRVIRAMGGYRDLALANTDSLPFREKRFAELWEELGEAEAVRVALPSFMEQPKKLSGPQRVGLLAVSRA